MQTIGEAMLKSRMCGSTAAGGGSAAIDDPGICADGAPYAAAGIRRTVLGLVV